MSSLSAEPGLDQSAALAMADPSQVSSAERQRNEIAFGEDERVQHEIDRGVPCRNDPNEVRFDSLGKIGLRGRRPAIGMRMKTADDAPFRTAETMQQIEMGLGVDQEMPLRIVGEIACKMCGRRAPAAFHFHAFEKATAFGRESFACRGENFLT